MTCGTQPEYHFHCLCGSDGRASSIPRTRRKENLNTCGHTIGWLQSIVYPSFPRDTALTPAISRRFMLQVLKMREVAQAAAVGAGVGGLGSALFCLRYTKSPGGMFLLQQIQWPDLIQSCGSCVRQLASRLRETSPS